MGNYELISVKVSKPIDADNDGSYDDIELINHIACNSSVVLNENKTFVWESLSVHQMNFNGEVELICNNYMEPGNYELTENSLQLACDHDEFFLMNLTGNEIKYITTDYFVTSNNNGETLTVTYTYKK